MGEQPRDIWKARRHCQTRAWQRFGLAVGEPEMRQAEADIWAGKAEWIADQRKMRSAYRVTIRGKKVIVIFDIRLDVIVTLLPNELWVTEFSAPGRRRS